MARRRTDTERVHAVMYKKCRQGAASRGLTFSLTREQAYELFAKPCSYCGRYDRRCTNEGPRNANLCVAACGIDRVNNARGYEAGNCVSCCQVCNLSKHTMDSISWFAWLRDLTLFQFRNMWEARMHDHSRNGQADGD